MANNGNGSQNGSSTGPVNGSDEQQPTGPLRDQAGIDSTPPSPPLSEEGAPSGGGDDSRPLGPPKFPLKAPRVAGAPGVEGGQKPLQPPYPTELSTPGSPLKVDVAKKAPKTMLQDIILKTCQETAPTVASRMYPDDPKSAVELAL